MGKGICEFAGLMSINITWSLSCYLPHLYAGLTLWFVYLSYNRKFAVRICTRLVWPGEPASVIILELESQQSATNCSPDTRYWHFRVSQAVTTFNELSSYCEVPATLISLFWISVIFTRSFARQIGVYLYASVLTFEKTLEYDPKQNRLRKLIPSTLNRFSDRRMKMFPCPWTKIPCTSVYYPKQSLKVSAARRVTTFVLKLQSKEVVAKLTFYKSKEF